MGIDSSKWKYAEWIVDSGATCMLVPPAFAPFISNKCESNMTIGGFTKEGTAQGTIHGTMAPHFIVTTKANIHQAGQTSIDVDVVPDLAQPLMSISDWSGEGPYITTFKNNDRQAIERVCSFFRVLS